MGKKIHVWVRTGYPQAKHDDYYDLPDDWEDMSDDEMVCDWYARSQEFGTGFREWITTQAVERFQIDVDGEQYNWVNRFVSILLEDHFVKGLQ